MLYALLGPKFWVPVMTDTAFASMMLPYDLSMLDRIPKKSTGPPVADTEDPMAMAADLRPTKVAA
jgi:hypothetical protein